MKAVLKRLLGQINPDINAVRKSLGDETLTDARRRYFVRKHNALIAASAEREAAKAKKDEEQLVRATAQAAKEEVWRDQGRFEAQMESDRARDRDDFDQPKPGSKATRIRQARRKAAAERLRADAESANLKADAEATRAADRLQ